MTREEAIKSALKYLVHKQQEQGSWGYADNDNTNEVSWNEVLEWIDQRSCGDLISREELTKKLEYLCDCLCDYSKRQREFMCDACKLGAVIDAVEELSSVEPEIKTGKWIPIRFKSPQQGQRVFISTIKGTIHDEIWDMNRIYNYATDGCWYRNWFVVAWMPFTLKPYKMEDNI